jgi:hypothetical protein
MHHVVMVVIIVIAMLTLCYCIMTLATLILFYPASMLTLQNTLVLHALWLPLA